MKKICLFLFLVTLSFKASSQEINYRLANTGEYVLGVYFFIYAEPTNDYDYVGKIDKFDIFKTDSKEVEKIITKARKKNAYFDGMVFKRNFDHIELIKFKTRGEGMSGYKVGDIVQYEAYGKIIKGEIVDIDDARKKVTVRYVDADGKEKIDGVRFQELNKAPN